MHSALKGIALTEQRIAVGLAHALPIVVAGMQAWLEAHQPITVVAAVSDGHAALAMLDAFRPAIAVLDAALPGLSGIAVAQRLRAAQVPTAIILVSASPRQTVVKDALEAGVRGLILQHSAPDHLAAAIRAVHDGGLSIDPEIASAFWGRGAIDGSRSQADLTVREADVLRAVAFGFSIKEIAANLGITPKSIETYKIRACDKLALGSRAQIVRYALLQGWFESSAPAQDNIPLTPFRERLWPSRP